MSRLIDADKFECVVLPDHSSNEFCNGATYILEKIDTAPTVSQWIPCSERLPEEDGKYLCTLKWPKHFCSVLGYTKDLSIIVYLNMINKKHESGFYEHDSEYGNYDVTKFVLAWMPLPEPYKEDRQ